MINARPLFVYNQRRAIIDNVARNNFKIDASEWVDMKVEGGRWCVGFCEFELAAKRNGHIQLVGNDLSMATWREKWMCPWPRALWPALVESFTNEWPVVKWSSSQFSSVLLISPLPFDRHHPDKQLIAASRAFACHPAQFQPFAQSTLWFILHLDKHKLHGTMVVWGRLTEINELTHKFCMESAMA